MKNYKLLDETLAYIEAFPDEWDQNNFVNLCGTKFCFAGHAALAAHPGWYLETTTMGVPLSGMLNSRREYVGRISEIAQADLRLTHDEAEALFFGTIQGDPRRNLRAIKRLIAWWKRADGIAS